MEAGRLVEVVEEQDKEAEGASAGGAVLTGEGPVVVGVLESWQENCFNLVSTMPKSSVRVVAQSERKVNTSV